jgi:hypothetical protein
MIIGKMGVAGNRRPIFRRLHDANKNVAGRKANRSSGGMPEECRINI